MQISIPTGAARSTPTRWPDTTSFLFLAFRAALFAARGISLAFPAAESIASSAGD
jgi:hypothetical protein